MVLPRYYQRKPQSTGQSPERRHVLLAGGVERIRVVRGLGMPGPRVDASNDVQPRSTDRGEQVVAFAKPQVLREVREDEPAFAAGLEMRGEPLDETQQHPALGIVDAVLQRRARSRGDPWRVAHHERC